MEFDQKFTWRRVLDILHVLKETACQMARLQQLFKMSLLVVLLKHCRYCVMLYVTCHNCSHDQLNQDSKAEVEGISGEDKCKVSTITFIVSSSQASPEYDMCVSVNINGRQTSHTVTIVRKACASRRCICQVFYQSTVGRQHLHSVLNSYQT